MDCEVLDIGITVLETMPDTLAVFLEQIADTPPPIEDAADFVENLRMEKFDGLIPEEMLRRVWVNAHREEASKPSDSKMK